MNSINQLIIMAPPLLLALTLHEYAHGYIAYRLGDPTARNAGRRRSRGRIRAASGPGAVAAP